MLKGHPCRIVKMFNQMKNDMVYFVGIEIFTGEKFEDSFPTHIVDVPFVKRTNFQVNSGACTEKNQN